MCLVRISREGVFVLDQESERGASCTFCIICKILRSCNAMVESALEILHSRIFLAYLEQFFSKLQGKPLFLSECLRHPQFHTQVHVSRHTDADAVISFKPPLALARFPHWVLFEISTAFWPCQFISYFSSPLIVLEIKHCSVTCAELAFFFQLRNMLKTCETTVFLKKP